MFRRFSGSAMITEAREQSRGKKIWLEVLIFLAVFMATSVISSVIIEIPMAIDMAKRIILSNESIFDVLLSAEDMLRSQKFILLSLFATVVTTVGTIIFCTKIEKRKIGTMGFAREHAAKEYFIGLAVGIALFAAALLLLVVFGAAKIRFSGGSIGMILLFLLGYLIQGMSEEVLLRGYFMISLARRNSIGWAVILSSVMFALLHIFNDGVSVMAIVNITLFGALMAVYMLKRGNIWGVCAIHSVWNFVQGNVFGVQVSGMPLSESVFATELMGSKWITGGSFGMEGGLAVTIVLLVGIALLMLRKRKST